MMLNQLVSDYKGEFINDIVSSVVNNDVDKLDDCIDAYKIMIEIIKNNKFDTNVTNSTLNNLSMFYEQLLFKRRELHG